MAIREKYRGQEQVHNANGAGMKISHIGQSLIRTPCWGDNPRYAKGMPNRMV
jgi:hypothetical protein